MSEPTLQQLMEWANQIKQGKWHTTMLNAFCDIAVKNQKRIQELEAQLAKEKRRRITSTRINNELHERIEGLEDKTLVEELESQLAESCEDMRSDYRTCPIAAKLESQLAEIADALNNDPSYGRPHVKDCPCGRCKIVTIINREKADE